MHEQVETFVRQLSNKYPDHFAGFALDAGSLDINGSNKKFFEATKYVGLDVGPGPNVDVVCPVHEYKPSRKFDVVISTEMIEHDRFWALSLDKMYELTRPGGLLIITCATDGRPEHGTERTSKEDSPHTTDWYRNLSPSDLTDIFSPVQFREYGLTVYQKPHADLHFYGIKAER